MSKLKNPARNGSVMAVWNGTPPYYIPDTGMAQFIVFTTAAMVARYLPGVRVVRPGLALAILLAILGSWWLGALLIVALFQFVANLF